MFTGALFTTARKWKQLKWSTTDECVIEMQCLYTMKQAPKQYIETLSQNTFPLKKKGSLWERLRKGLYNVDTMVLGFRILHRQGKNFNFFKDKNK